MFSSFSILFLGSFCYIPNHHATLLQPDIFPVGRENRPSLQAGAEMLEGSSTAPCKAVTPRGQPQMPRKPYKRLPTSEPNAVVMPPVVTATQRSP